MRTGDLTTPYPRLAFCGMGEGNMPSPLHPLPSAREKAGPRVTRVKELAMPLIKFSTQESRGGYYTPSGKHTGADPVVLGTGEPVLRV